MFSPTRLLRLLTLFSCVLIPQLQADVATSALPAVVSLEFENLSASVAAPELFLRGSDARQQVLVLAKLDTGGLRDLTRDVRYEVDPEGVVTISRTGRVMPVGNGRATITARAGSEVNATLPVTVSGFETVVGINFPNQIVPIFTKAGCNGGGCHGKSGGQNGFRLSLLGFEPSEDWEHLVKEARGRRLFPAAPERSLLLTKGTATLPHGGGKRLDAESDDYHLLVRWISQGMPYGKDTDPHVDRIEVFPKQRTMALRGQQQLVVLAHYNNGATEDVTGSALYEANDKEMAKADESGHVGVFDQPGEVAVMVRYQAKVAVFRASIPLGAPVDKLPPPANFVDELVFKQLQAIGMPPSEPCDDATFLRRVSLDVAGRLPTMEESKAFLTDPGDSKRDRVVDGLLDSGGYADYFANKWSALLRNKRNSPTYKRGNFAFYNWIRDSILANKPYDQFVREIVAASGDVAEHPAVVWYREVNNPTAESEDTAQLFLGQRMKCAQCHHHPYEKWSQEDYYSFAAFFSQVGRKRSEQPGEDVIFHRRGKATATNKKTQQPVTPAGLGAEPLELSPDDDPRLALADWMTESDNNFFARALVNRYWKHFFNRGLVDPEDDMRDTNPASNPELLDALAKSFIDHHYDLKELIRTICRSRTYQLSAIPNKYNGIDRKNFSRYYPKRLTAEVLFDAVNGVMGSESRFDGLPVGTHAVQLPDNSFNASSYFLTVFGRPDMSSSCECERSQDASLAQCLHLLNAKEIQDKLASEKGRAALLALDKAHSDNEKMTDLYHLVYSRPPTAAEIETGTSYLRKKTETKDEKKELSAVKREAYEDIVWALVNTKEFLFNH